VEECWDEASTPGTSLAARSRGSQSGMGPEGAVRLARNLRGIDRQPSVDVPTHGEPLQRIRHAKEDLPTLQV